MLGNDGIPFSGGGGVVEGREGERSVRVECEWREWGGVRRYLPDALLWVIDNMSSSKEARWRILEE